MHEEITLKIKELLSGLSVKECKAILVEIKLELEENSKFNPVLEVGRPA